MMSPSNQSNNVTSDLRQGGLQLNRRYTSCNTLEMKTLNFFTFRFFFSDSDSSFGPMEDIMVDLVRAVFFVECSLPSLTGVVGIATSYLGREGRGRGRRGKGEGGDGGGGEGGGREGEEGAQSH